MRLHANARLTPAGRLLLCRRVCDQGRTLRQAAEAAGVSERTARRWLARYRAAGLVGLARAQRSDTRTRKLPAELVELIEGMGLNFLIETKSKDLTRKRIDILMQIADALDYVHQQKYLHRDICPRNVIVTKEGMVKHIDFGLSIPYKPEFCRPGNRTGSAAPLSPTTLPTPPPPPPPHPPPPRRCARSCRPSLT